MSVLLLPDNSFAETDSMWSCGHQHSSGHTDLMKKLKGRENLFCTHVCALSSKYNLLLSWTNSISCKRIMFSQFPSIYQIKRGNLNSNYNWYTFVKVRSSLFNLNTFSCISHCKGCSVFLDTVFLNQESFTLRKK